MNNYILRPAAPDMANFHFHNPHAHQFEQFPENYPFPPQQHQQHQLQQFHQQHPPPQLFSRPHTSGTSGTSGSSYQLVLDETDPLAPAPMTSGYDFSFSDYADMRTATPQQEEFQIPSSQMIGPAGASFSSAFQPDQFAMERDPRLNPEYFQEDSADLRLLMYGLFPGQNEPPIGHPGPIGGAINGGPPAHPNGSMNGNPEFSGIPPMPPAQAQIPPPPPQPLRAPSPAKSVSLGPTDLPDKPPLLVTDAVRKTRPTRKRASRSRAPKRPSQGSKSSSRDSNSTVFSRDSLDSLSSSNSVTSIESSLTSPSKISPIAPTSVPSIPNVLPQHHCKIVRGVASGGSSVRPPEPSQGDLQHLQVELVVGGQPVKDVCHSKWSRNEKLDRRRIVRIERRQKGHFIYIDFSVVGYANDHPEMEKPPPDTDVVEVSCLAWDRASDEDKPGTNFYITSVEVVAIVETLIQSKLMDSKLRRRERGRIRSNLLTFWSKASYHSKAKEAERRAEEDREMTESQKEAVLEAQREGQKRKAEFARSIMAYEVRKPRGFDKGFRILRWDKLVPALQRALQCYYAEMTSEQRDLYTSMECSTAMN
ncbi:hypothetical protein FT663_04521 [Candidozyma haemuli var. vulneris]|uniref:DUF7082 domain-containing protein n=1 Tax=Candidozyma haemuli TaxID=45357 RepID=A0A2V1APS2_9ASCO|nr:hypothetical protein CXQ85_001558 [[Candida] haemuloni]KAF3986483.1 hypothetical protein FT662_04550 [[Candida] haemuloni var. vulneris]KAF3987262.1 hypothetical protein FT663_04521 [[Candida] haemuloni var. vulneris]PVH19253.1 hypothetical protein CXQ85_001558 [[Candida] haemuloni]